MKERERRRVQWTYEQVFGRYVLVLPCYFRLVAKSTFVVSFAYRLFHFLELAIFSLLPQLQASSIVGFEKVKRVREACPQAFD